MGGSGAHTTCLLEEMKLLKEMQDQSGLFISIKKKKKSTFFLWFFLLQVLVTWSKFNTLHQAISASFMVQFCLFYNLNEIGFWQNLEKDQFVLRILLLGFSGVRKTINSELWHACAGPLVSLPQLGSLVYYFPQGHSEQVCIYFLCSSMLLTFNIYSFATNFFCPVSTFYCSTVLFYDFLSFFGISVLFYFLGFWPTFQFPVHELLSQRFHCDLSC